MRVAQRLRVLNKRIVWGGFPRLPRTKRLSSAFEAALRAGSARNQGNFVDCPRHAIGRAVAPDRAAAAVRCFAQIWEHSLFDCDPQDYEGMTRDILDIMAIPPA
jgi:hypothetical protein